MIDSLMKCGFSILFVDAMVLFRRVSLGHHRSGTVFSYFGSNLESTATRAPAFPATPRRIGRNDSPLRISGCGMQGISG